MKRLILILLMFTLSFSACSSNKNDDFANQIIGEWKFDNGKQMMFREDYTGETTYSTNTSIETFKWTYDENANVCLIFFDFATIAYCVHLTEVNGGVIMRMGPEEGVKVQG